MTPSLDPDDAATVFRVLGHGVRLRLLAALAACERSVSDMENHTGVGQPMLSQQLGVLRKAELVITRREAKQVFYRLDRERLSGLKAILDGLTNSADAHSTKKAHGPGHRSHSVAMFARLDRAQG